MQRLMVGLFIGVLSLAFAQVQVAETEVFNFSTDMGDAAVSPTGIINELRERYKIKGVDLGEADARLIPLDITVTSGMGDLELDFSGLNISALSVTTDMGNIAVTLSELGTTSGSLTTGMGDITLQLPANRSLAVTESATGMGDIVIDGAVNQSGTEGAVTLNLTTDMGEIVIAPMGAMMDHSEAMGTDEASSEETDAMTTTTETTADTDETTADTEAQTGTETQAGTETQTIVTLDGTVSITTGDGSVAVGANGDITVTEVNFSDEVITVDGMGGEQTFDCAGRDVVVNGTQLALTLTGVCDNIEINGATNTVTVDAVRSLVVNGLANSVTYLYTLNGSAPSAELIGLNNVLEHKQ